MSSTQSKFPSASREDWHALVSAALKGGDPQSLDRLDEDGLAIKALYDIASKQAFYLKAFCRQKQVKGSLF